MLSVRRFCCGDALAFHVQGVKLLHFLHEACIEVRCPWILCTRIRVCVARLLCCLHKAMAKFQASSSASHIVKGDSACRWIESASSFASSLFVEGTYSFVFVTFLVFCFGLIISDGCCCCYCSKKREKIIRFPMLSLLWLIGRVYESNNCKDFKRNSNERQQPSFFERVMIGEPLTLSPRIPTSRN